MSSIFFSLAVGVTTVMLLMVIIVYLFYLGRFLFELIKASTHEPGLLYPLLFLCVVILTICGGISLAIERIIDGYQTW
jgi:hypothetical protein